VDGFAVHAFNHHLIIRIGSLRRLIQRGKIERRGGSRHV